MTRISMNFLTRKKFKDLDKKSYNSINCEFAKIAE